MVRLSNGHMSADITTLLELLEGFLFMDFPSQKIINGRYYARPYPGLGVTIWTVASPIDAVCQLFPYKSNLQDDYVAHVLLVAGSSKHDEPLRTLYPVLHAEDPLTMKCLIIEAAEKWRQHRCSDTNSPL